MQYHIIGQGKLGRSIAALCSKNGLAYQLWGRQDKYHLEGVVYICVPEDQISTVAQQIEFGPIVLHSSGSLGLEALHPHQKIGCLHPVQSFVNPTIALPETRIPATFQGDETLLKSIQPFIDACGFHIFPYHGSRLSYHTAAVISGNFATILFHQAVSLLCEEGMHFDDACALLLPLAQQSLENAPKGTLAEVLTGPIARGQYPLINTQLHNLQQHHPHLAPLYDIMTKIGLNSCNY